MLCEAIAYYTSCIYNYVYAFLFGASVPKGAADVYASEHTADNPITGARSDNNMAPEEQVPKLEEDMLSSVEIDELSGEYDEEVPDDDDGSVPSEYEYDEEEEEVGEEEEEVSEEEEEVSEEEKGEDVSEVDDFVELEHGELPESSAIASSKEEYLEMEDGSTPRPDVGGSYDEGEVSEGGSSLLAHDMGSEMDESVSLESSLKQEEAKESDETHGKKAGSSIDYELPLIDAQTTSSTPSKAASRKLKWTPKPSVPHYLIHAEKNLNLDQLEKMTITTKGKAERLAAANREKIASKVKEVKQKFIFDAQKSKEESMLQRKLCVANERARVMAAAKAREEQAKRVKLEAAERRRKEMAEKIRLVEEAEKKRAELQMARRNLLGKPEKTL